MGAQILYAHASIVRTREYGRAASDEGTSTSATLVCSQKGMAARLGASFPGRYRSRRRVAAAGCGRRTILRLRSLRDGRGHAAALAFPRRCEAKAGPVMPPWAEKRV